MYFLKKPENSESQLPDDAGAGGCGNKAELMSELQEWAKGLLKELLLWAEWKERPGGQSV